ncbi:MAG TPA: transketolase, partial [Proteobacteria bacterium]|nr:transketolase [Pseudomonadota bacterium]
AAAGLLARDGIDAQVVNLRFAKPLDHEIILAAAATTGRLVTLEEGQLAGGV